MGPKKERYHRCNDFVTKKNTEELPYMPGTHL